MSLLRKVNREIVAIGAGLVVAAGVATLCDIKIPESSVTYNENARRGWFHESMAQRTYSKPFFRNKEGEKVSVPEGYVVITRHTDRMYVFADCEIYGGRKKLYAKLQGSHEEFKKLYPAIAAQVPDPLLVAEKAILSTLPPFYVPWEFKSVQQECEEIQKEIMQ